MLASIFAQANRLDPEIPLALAITLVVGFCLLLAFIVFILLLMRHLRRSRELLNTERIKALEAGQSPTFSPPDRSQERYGHNAFWIAFWVGAVVPMAVTGAAASATTQGHFDHLGILIVIWSSVAAISVASVICATVLMVSARRVASGSGKGVPPSLAKGEDH